MTGRHVTMNHLDDILPEWALGTLDAATAEVAERHLTECARCRAEALRWVPAREGLTALVAPVEPPPQVLSRLMEQVEGPGRLARFADRVAAFFDLTRERALEVLAAVSDPAAWMPGPVEGSELMPVEAGPAREGMLAGILRLHPGVRYPTHTHHGREWNLVLEGGFREDDGHEVWPGEELEKTESSAHGFTALDGPACLCASVLEGMASFEEELAAPE
ncbi:dimethylsulfonioproprionate lyase family protein [Pyxidicoccus xibeiensis]|uniref:dimethylsulfonioproprionate lyase family protein n=1 Tax=Pyxidicoccus xibeiensis TaxID=2906759 RepID=UPI0020A70D41|nr:dimethylsulfonioproprionate lyase family protein [Pyxidicoccus xibeiensis]MCP3139685.1 dimethylsulfonioproprionate lyase family protein [Pyxidicoccus xibeiensis]